MRAYHLMVVGSLLCGGCGNDAPLPGAPGSDLSVRRDGPLSPDGPAQADSAVPDMSVPPPDLVGRDLSAPPFCAGTRVEGTCAQKFFGSAWRCFMASGQCQSGNGGFGHSDYCWASGAAIRYSGSSCFRDWLHNGATCMSGTCDNQNGRYFTGMDSVGFDEATGKVTCPDGTMVNIGPSFGGCLTLKQLLSPPSNADCPPGMCN